MDLPDATDGILIVVKMSRDYGRATLESIPDLERLARSL